MLRGHFLNSGHAIFPETKPEPYQQSMASAAAVLRRLPGEIFISKQKLRQAEAVECVRLKRDSANQSLGFASRPFVLCGLSSSASGARNFMKTITPIFVFFFAFCHHVFSES